MRLGYHTYALYEPKTITQSVKTLTVQLISKCLGSKVGSCLPLWSIDLISCAIKQMELNAKLFLLAAKHTHKISVDIKWNWRGWLSNTYSFAVKFDTRQLHNDCKRSFFRSTWQHWLCCEFDLFLYWKNIFGLNRIENEIRWPFLHNQFCLLIFYWFHTLRAWSAFDLRKNDNLLHFK